MKTNHLKQKNPKTHDSLLKWLIASFINEFFDHYFPKITVRIGKDPFLDKEFISKYEALKASLIGDIFLSLEVEINGLIYPIVIHIENESKKEDMRTRVYEYHCYAWLLKKRPVWSIVIYSDDAKWKKDVENHFWYGFDSQDQKLFHRFDVIKINKEKSIDLLKKQSLLCKLLALKADDTGIDRTIIIREIYHHVKTLGNQIDNEKLLLIEQFVNFYKKIPNKTFESIKKEVNMQIMATTIKEHYIHQGEIIGEKRGEKNGEKRGLKIGEIKGEINSIRKLYKQRILTKSQYESRIKLLNNKLARFE